MRGLQDLTIVQEISIRSDEIDKKLRQIQKQSQIDAMVGLVNEDEAYSADKGTRADLSMDFILNTVGKDKYQIVCTVSEIEEMKVLTTQTTARLSFSELTDNKIIDELIYNLLLDFQKRGLIKPLTQDVRKLLLQQDISDNEINYLELANKAFDEGFMKPLLITL